MAEIVLELKINTAYPTAAVPRRRFEKQLADSPWSGVIAAVVELDDSPWELLGHPRVLKAIIA